MSDCLIFAYGVLTGATLVLAFALFAGMCCQRRTDKVDKGYPGMDYYEGYLSDYTDRGYDDARR